MATNLYMDNAREIAAVPVIPVAPEPGDPVLIGAALPGVALTRVGEGGNIATECSVDLGGAYNLEVSTATEAGDIINIVAGTGVLTTGAGVRFGYALTTQTVAGTVQPVKIGW